VRRPFEPAVQTALITQSNRDVLPRGPDRSGVGSEVDLPMAYTAKGDEIFFHIPSQQAARLHMMDLEIFGASASLAAPAIAFEYLPAEAPISIMVQAKLRAP
jgi:hypothetical protein